MTPKEKTDKNLNPHTVIRIVTKYYGISEEEMQKNRKRKNVVAKQVCQSIIRKLCKNPKNTKLKLSFDEIGKLFKSNSGKTPDSQIDHATIIHSCKTIDNLIFSDKRFKEEYNFLLKQCDRFSGYTFRGCLVKEIEFLQEELDSAKKKLEDFDGNNIINNIEVEFETVVN